MIYEDLSSSNVIFPFFSICIYQLIVVYMFLYTAFNSIPNTKTLIPCLRRMCIYVCKNIDYFLMVTEREMYISSTNQKVYTIKKNLDSLSKIMGIRILRARFHTLVKVRDVMCNALYIFCWLV